MDKYELGMSEYIAAGGNRHPAAADWDRETGLLAYGTDRNIALWEPAVSLINPFHWYESGQVVKGHMSRELTIFV